MKTSCLYVLLQIVIISSQAVTSLLADESYQSVNTTKDGVTKCPSYFSFSFAWEVGTFSDNVFFDCKNLTWYPMYGACTYATCIIPRTQTKCDIGVDGSEISANCPSDCVDDCKCKIDFLSYDDFLPTDPCVPYVIDKNCPASFLYVRHENLTWMSCHEGYAVGTFTNPENKEVCGMIVESWGSRGSFVCPSWGEGYCNYGRDYNGFLGICVTSDSRPLLPNDGSCAIPHFKCKGLLWDFCTKGDGAGQCTNIFLDIPEKCTVSISSVCDTGAESCGIINCEESDCVASWNMPNRPQFYDFPEGCMGKSINFPSDNNEIIIPAVIGSVVFVGTASVIGAACYFYHRYKRQGYQSVH
ncbi:hypothetical protein [Endozoicomonas sp. 2B-B]